MKIGIVGLPNVGKSTLFNALTKQSAESANFPFTTIEPNVGVVAVPDERLSKLTELSKSAKTVPTSIEFVDIAGLVKNAHKGEGLGNQFLANIREVDAIAHVVRYFENSDIQHVDNSVDPLRDIETIETELALADLNQIETQLKNARDKAKGNDKEALARVPVLEKIEKHLADGNQARDLELTQEQQEAIKNISLLTAKPTLYIANVDEEQIKNPDQVILPLHKGQPEMILPISIKIEQELIELSEEERQVFLEEYNLKSTGLERLITAAYKLLNLITFFTTGEKETRAWTVTNGSLAPQAAGKIHTDFERGFIRAETVHYNDLVATGSYAKARAAGKVRDEGKQYKVKDGDIFIFKFSK